MVIMGGLAAVALLALIGLFLVLRSGSDPTKPAASQTLPLPVPATAKESDLNSSALLASGEDWALVLANPELRGRLRGQLRELKYELYYLHQRSREIGQRADLLAGIIARTQELTSNTTLRTQPTEQVPQRARHV
jgi:hypothetical protein